MAIVVPVISTWNGAGLDKAVRDVAAAESGLNKVQAVGRGMQSVGRSMTLGLTVPIAGLATVATKTAATFESTMAQIASVSGETGAVLESSMRAAREEIIRMGTETIYSSQDAADAFLALQKAGVSTGDAIGGGLSSAMNLAATEGMDLAFAAEIMAQAMNAYNIPASESAKITDILAAGAINSTASVTSLAGGLKYVSSTAAALGVPLDDTVVALAELNNAGLTATTAGTSLNQMMVALMAPTKAAQGAMDRLGFSMLDANGNMKSMPQIIEDLDKSMSGLSEPQKQAALKEMFNTRGMRAANILLKENSAGWEDLDAKINTAGGAAQLADARMSGMAGTLERARGAAETAGISFGNALKPVIDAVVTAVTNFLNWFSRLPSGVQTAIAVILLLIAVLGPVILFIGALISALTVIIPIISTAALVIGVIAGAFFWWIIAIAAVVAAVIALVVVIVKNWDKILDWTKETWQKIVDTVKGWLDKFKDMFPNVFGFITGYIKFVWNLISTIFTTALDLIWNYVKFAFNTIWTIIKTVFDVVVGYIKAFFTIIWEVFKAGFKFVMTIVETALGVIKAIFTGDFDKVGEIIRSGISNVLKIFSTLGSRVGSAIGDLGKTLFQAGKDLIQGLIDGVKSMLGGLTNIVKSAIDKINPFKKAASEVGVSAHGVMVGASRASRGRAGTTVKSVVINISEAPDSVLAARRVKRALESYDSNQGRAAGQVLARAW